MIRAAVAISCLAVAVAGGEWAAAASGSGQLSGRSVLAVKGCGTDRVPLVLAAELRSDGTWAAVDQEAGLFSGTWAPRGARGRSFDLQFDDATAAAFVGTVVADVGELCEAAATVDTVQRRRFILKLNRRQTRATLVLSYRLTGTAAGERGTARYRVAVKGPWAPGA